MSKYAKLPGKDGGDYDEGELDEEDGLDEEDALVKKGGNKKKGKTTREKGKDLSLWARTFVIGFFNMAVTVAIIGACMIFSLWLASATILVLLITCECNVPWVWRWAYRKAQTPPHGNKNNQEWAFTLGRVTLFGVLFGSTGAVVGGYFLRVSLVAHAGQEYTSLRPQDPPAQDLGIVHSFGTNHRLQRALAGRSAAYGFWPVCVAPILDSAGTLSTASYWAAGHGECCAKEIPDCSGWNQAGDAGGIRLKYIELYPTIGDAIDDAIKMHRDAGLLSHPDAYVMYYGDADDIVKSAEYRATLILGCTWAMGVGLMLLKSIFGEYV